MNPSKAIRRFFTALPLLLALAPVVAHAAVSQVPAQVPLFVNNAVPPLNMLVVARDHKLFFPAYNDASDLDGDGSIDLHYKPTIDYLGYFDSYKCYTYNSGSGGYFSASGTTTAANLKKCPGSWSGDFLNYVTTSRADALRKVLYGGYRDVDTATQTILSRAFITTDAHTWGKEYIGAANTADLIKANGYLLSDYTPLSTNPVLGSYTLFANNSNVNNTTAPNIGSNPPLMRVLSNIANVRVFGWVSRDGTEGSTTATNTSGGNISVSPTNYSVRVEVCKLPDSVTKLPVLETNCKVYPNGQYKPTGILHDYGEGNQMYFGLMTGTYNNNMQGGVLRKAMSSFSTEIDPTSGIFGTKSTSGNTTTYTKGSLIGTLDGLLLANAKCNDTGSTGMTNGNCNNWGNPLAEMMFETLRYFSGTTSPTAGYAAGSIDTGLGLTSVGTWSNPYSSSPNANATQPTYPSCAKPFQTLVSDVNPNYDSDLPGSSFTVTGPTTATTLLGDFNATSLGATIWSNDVGGTKNINIGQTTTQYDTAPTAKSASSFGTIRGLPEEPTKQGTFNAAAVAYYGNTHAITTPGNQKVQTLSIALSSTLPRIQMPVGGGTITLVPFGKVTNTTSTEQLTGFYVDSMYNMPGQPSDSTVNGGRAQAIFRVVYDDCEQSCDYDMDAIVLYTVSVTAAGTLNVVSSVVYASAGNESHMGYTISGTTADGIYLEVTGGGTGLRNYVLDTPGTQLPGSCANPASNTSSVSATCAGSSLPGLNSSHSRTFTPSTATLITNLQNPLWYAAKWGGFGDTNNVTGSTPVSGQWDSAKSGTPNNYFLVTSASNLKTQLAAAFNQILQKNSSVAAPAVSPVLGTTNSNATYVNSMNVAYWSGDLTKTTITTTTTSTTSTQNWIASQQMPAWGSRNIKMANSAGTALQAFSYSNLSGMTYAGVNLQSTLTQDQVNFILGDTSKETSDFRKRASLIGDIVNSGPVVVTTAKYIPSIAETLDGSAGEYQTFKTAQASRRGQVYVGANDGMLHGFDTATGVEKFAFIPTAVIANLNNLAAKTYNTDSSFHRFFVDGSPVTSDIYYGGAWHTILVGTLGAGGREIFALDVTDPDSISLLWEYTSQTDTDIGYTYSKPLILRMHSGDWGVIVGNGYSGNNGASLLVINAATGKLVKKLTTPASTNNGLSSPVVLDSNSDGIADYAYAGDLVGNLWRFDLNDSSAANWVVSFNNKPLYTATVSDANGADVQSITAPPVVVRHPSSTGILVIFGTGRYFATADKTTTDLQTLYGIWDKQAGNSTTVLNRSNLQAQTITAQSTGTFGSTTQVVRTVSGNAVDWTSKYGWYLDLVVGTTYLGERMVDQMLVTGSVLLVSTRTPSTDICTPGITGWTYGLDPNTGGKTTFSVFNFSRTGTITEADKLNGGVVSGYATSAGGLAFISNSGSGSGSTNGTTGGTNGAPLASDGTTGPGMDVGNQYQGRQSWRVIPWAQ